MPDPPETARGLVLIVDDEAAIRFGVSEALRHDGYEVEAVGDGTEALARLAARRFEAVLSDISMPGMSGLELLRRVRALDFDLPVVLLTGDPRLETAIEAVDAGALRYLQKPVSIAEIEATLETAVRLCRLARWKRDSLAYLGEHRLVADEHALDWALDEALKGLFLAAQPIVRATDGSLFGRELLLRTISPRLPDPPAVLEAAERLGRIRDVGRVVRRLAAAVAIPGGTSLFVNVHSLELEDDDLHSDDTPLATAAKDVVLEVTERGRIDAVSDLNRRISRLRTIGYRIAIDDFGAGYAEKATLVELGCDLLQGFLVGRPLPVSG